MGFKDFMKNAQEKAGTAASAAQEKASAMASSAQEAHAKRQEEQAIKREEEAKKLAETKEAISEYQNNLKDNIMGNFTGEKAFEMPDNILDFTKSFFEKLLLPANSSSNSRITMYPYHAKIVKNASKKLEIFDASEIPLFHFKNDGSSYVILTPTKFYFTYPYPEEPKFAVEMVIPIENISSLEFAFEDEIFKVLCNKIKIFETKKSYEFDAITINEYIRRLKDKDYEISEDQIDQIIRTKIGDNVLKVVREYAFDDEKLIYFAWGLDSITAKDFIVCTNKQIIIMDRELLGATKNVKQFYYEDITSMGTDQNAEGMLDLALTAAMKLCTVTIYVSGAQEKIETLYTREAERVIRIYQEYRRSIKENANRPQVVVQQAAPVEDDAFAKLEKLNKLKAAGIISDEEFAEKKAVLLSNI